MGEGGFCLLFIGVFTGLIPKPAPTAKFSYFIFSFCLSEGVSGEGLDIGQYGVY
jgi:hypothetical protein